MSDFARSLRKNPTEAEQRLWWHLRHSLRMPGTHFRRQVRIGPYIADFACHKLKLVIEVDGGQHVADAARDARRTAVLDQHGYRVLRFWNNDVLSNIEGVLVQIEDAAAQVTPTPNPSPQGGGE
jgi:very-short-patch-repair endonuclease